MNCCNAKFLRWVNSTAIAGLIMLTSSSVNAQDNDFYSYVVGDLETSAFVDEEGDSVPLPFPVAVDKTTDPAGHSCCISVPFGTFTFTWRGGDRMDVNGSEGAAILPYLPLQTSVSPTGEISGDGQSTVAGFSNVNTGVTGQFTPDGIELQLAVGDNGALPGGVPITFDLTLSYGGFFHFSQIASPVLGLSAATGQSVRDWEIDPDKLDRFNLYLQMEQDGDETAKDWFVVMLEPDGDVASFNLATLQFEPGVMPTYQGPMIDLPATQLFSSPVKPEAGTIIAFGVDAMDGQLNADVQFNAITVIYPQ